MTELWNLRGLDLFDGLKPHEIDDILDIVTTESFEPGAFVFRPGDPHDRLYFLHHGRVKTYVYSEAGQEKVLHIFVPGDAFGGLLLPTTDEELPWAEALDDVVVSYLGEPSFQRFMQTCPDLFMNLFRHVCAHHAHDMRRIESLMHAKASHRLVQALLQLGDRLGHRQEEQFELGPNFTHEDLANMIGAARQTVSRSISELRRAGVLEGEGRCLVVNRQAAEQFLQEDG